MREILILISLITFITVSKIKNKSKNYKNINYKDTLIIKND